MTETAARSANIPVLGELTTPLRQQWTPWTAGVLLGAINVFMFAYAKPWGVAEGVQNWGNWVLLGLGVDVGEQAAPWQFTTSVTSLALVFGAFIAALLAGEFSFRSTTRRDLMRAIIGGILLGIGSTLGIGCTIGGFFTAFSALSLAGPVFMVGLIGGTWLGLKLLVWDLNREAAVPNGDSRASAGGGGSRSLQPVVGLLVLAATVVYLLLDDTPFTYAGITGQRSVLVFFGLALGIVSQRSRFCFVRAFREPFMTGDASMTKGVMLALLVGTVGFTILKGTDLADYRSVLEVVNPSVWLGSLSGGVIFGIGMVLCGGCASGSLWRLGEGQMKFVVVLGLFAITNAVLSFVLRTTDLREAWGDTDMFLPDYLGWNGALILLSAILVGWYALAAWNEKSEKLVINV